MIHAEIMITIYTKKLPADIFFQDAQGVALLAFCSLMYFIETGSGLKLLLLIIDYGIAPSWHILNRVCIC